MHIYWLWATLGLIFLVLEVFLGAQFFLFFIASAILITSALGSIFFWQATTLIWVGAILSMLFLILWSYLFKDDQSKLIDVNNPLISLKGEIAQVIQCDDSSSMKIKIGHVLWSARSVDHKKIPLHSTVRVVGLDGIKLIVERVEPSSSL